MKSIRPLDGVPVELNGKTYNLIYTSGAFKYALHLFRKQGYSVSAQDLQHALMGRAQDEITEITDEPFVFAVIVYLGICGGHRSSMPEFSDVLEWLDAETTERIALQINEALKKSFPEPDKDAKKEDEGPSPFPTNGSASDGRSQDSISGSEPDQNLERGTTNSGISPQPNSTPSGSDT